MNILSLFGGGLSPVNFLSCYMVFDKWRSECSGFVLAEKNARFSVVQSSLKQIQLSKVAFLLRKSVQH